MQADSDAEESLSLTSELRVAYILHRFPHLTETFIVRELHWVRRYGANLAIFSLLDPRSGPVHEDARALLPFVRYSAFLSIKIVHAHLFFIGQSPSRYLVALFKAFRLSYREPGLFIRTIAVLPKIVYFAKQMQDMNVRHIHAHFAWLGGIAASVVAELLGVTYTIHPHAFDLFTRDRRSLQMLLEDASQIVTISDYHRSYIASICPHKTASDILVVHCGVDLELFETSHKSAVKPELLILSVGSLNAKKGHEYLIDACALLAERGIAFRCDIVGDGAYRRHEALRARIQHHGLQDHVALLGPMKQEQLLERYQRSDVFALACVVAQDGDRDGIPVVLMEAMACELPVITTPVAGIPELVEDEITGFLVEERDEVSLATALERLIVNKPLRDKLGKQARKKVQADFDIRKTSKELVMMFQRFILYSRKRDEVQCE
ncbi:MAG: glycosyltransferase [Anaerolineae bacterium]|nr:glycosyltransferase [Anaerolineae bacterium]